MKMLLNEKQLTTAEIESMIDLIEFTDVDPEEIQYDDEQPYYIEFKFIFSDLFSGLPSGYSKEEYYEWFRVNTIAVKKQFPNARVTTKII